MCLSSILVSQFYRVAGEQRWLEKGLGELRTIAVRKRIVCAAITDEATTCGLILIQLSFAYLTFLVSPPTYGWVQLANRSSNSHGFKHAWKLFFWLEHFQAFFYLTHFLRINLSYQQPWEVFFCLLQSGFLFPLLVSLKPGAFKSLLICYPIRLTLCIARICTCVYRNRCICLYLQLGTRCPTSSVITFELIFWD